MRTFSEFLKQRMIEEGKDPDGYNKELMTFNNTYQGDENKKAREKAEEKWGSLGAFLHSDDEGKWSRLWASLNPTERD